uniref:Uncharacterized protein n=1 Tax=Aegilops tauschii subsp. strangulata TaxID=200361 RepID=A0A453MGG2_AEGTS
GNNIRIQDPCPAGQQQLMDLDVWLGHLPKHCTTESGCKLSFEFLKSDMKSLLIDLLSQPHQEKQPLPANCELGISDIKIICMIKGRLALPL